MRARLAFVLVAHGCYAPTARDGAPCDVVHPACPSDQSCWSDNRCRYGAQPIDGPDLDASFDAAVDATPLAPLMIAPSIAACVDPSNAANACTKFGTQTFVVDGADETPSHRWDGFLRFDLAPGSLAGRTVDRVALHLTVTDSQYAVSSMSGQVWLTTMFTAAQLSAGNEPTKLGAAAIAGDQGSVVNQQHVTFVLPTTTVASTTTAVYLELYPTNGDAVYYWNAAGVDPPRLEIDIH